MRFYRYGRCHCHWLLSCTAFKKHRLGQRSPGTMPSPRSIANHSGSRNTSVGRAYRICWKISSSNKPRAANCRRKISTTCVSIQFCGNRGCGYCIYFLITDEKAFHGNPEQFITFEQFCKTHFVGTTFSFWEWFYANMKLTKNSLKELWEVGSIKGFISKQNTKDILINSPPGTFLCRFSDSKRGKSNHWTNISNWFVKKKWFCLLFQVPLRLHFQNIQKAKILWFGLNRWRKRELLLIGNRIVITLLMFRTSLLSIPIYRSPLLSVSFVKRKVSVNVGICCA